MENLKAIWEAILFLTGRPVPVTEVAESLSLPEEDLSRAVEALLQDYQDQDRGMMIREVAGGYQMITSPAVAEPLSNFFTKVRKLKLSRAGFETLALVAYRQPITRGEIEHIRGVDCTGVLGTLLEAGLIAVLGRRDVPGRPLIYGTTPLFLERFGLKALVDLPTMEEIDELVGEERDLGSEDGEPGDE